MRPRGIKRSGIWLARGLALALLLACLAVLAAYLYLRGSLPQTEGSFSLPGLAAPVEVWRDPNGIPTLRAQSEADAYRALGFLHAQDRLWQMDMTRRISAGRLSEVVGSTTLEIDRLLRTLGLYRAGQTMTAQLSDEARAALDAYVEGVNAYLETREKPLPPPFLALGYEPEPWRAEDSVAWGALMALQLSGDWREEILRHRLAKRLSAEDIAFLWPRERPGDPVTGVADDRVRIPEETTRALLDALPWPLAPKTASNWWILSGARSATGMPLLANDPHLSLNAPSPWYLARLEWPGRVLAGVTAPGVPFPIVAHNGEIAWGFTTTHGDTQDLFIERLDEEGRKHLTETGWQALDIRKETIGVSGGEDLEIEVRVSRHGPLISDAVRRSHEMLGGSEALALSWPLYDPENRSAEAFYRLTKAANREDFLAAMRLVKTPQQNVAFADGKGDIGFVTAGAVPLRKAGDGSLPQPGWVGEAGWSGYLPFEALPQSFDPPNGVLVNANNRVTPEDYPHLIARSWPDAVRAERIEERLAEKERFTPEEAAAIHSDAHSGTAEDLLPLLLPLLDAGIRERPEVKALEGWDRNMDRGRPEPLIFATWMRQLMQAMLADELGPDFADLARPDRRLIARILEESPRWCDDISTAEKQEDCSAAAGRSLESALALLGDRFGQDWRSWRWGAAHVAPFRHNFYGRIPVVREIFSLALGTDGWDDTVNRGGADLGWDEPERMFQHRHGATIRALFDLSDLDQSLFMITPGQSENPLSPHYANFLLPWRDGLYVKLVGKTTDEGETLLLTPAGE